MTKIALVIGHNARSQGAVRVTDQRTEYDWCADLATAIRDCGPGIYEVFRRPAGRPYSAEIRETYAVLSAKGVLASVELHFNGGPASATGTETLTSGSVGSRRLAGLIQPAMVQALGLRDRGIITRGKYDRGGLSLHAARPPAVLLEPYFGSNPGDCDAATRNFSALARAIHGACLAYLKGV